jgi:predicted nicotinamide N-methyase/GNAT superfamily N-acetyltransferase
VTARTDTERVAIRIAPADPAARVAAALLEEYTRELDALYAPEGGLAAGIPFHADEFRAPRGAFLVAWDGERPVGCAGLRGLGAGVAEVKRVYVAPEARGRGVARALMDALEGAATALGLGVLRLDTGPRQPGSRELFEAAGYRAIEDYNGNRLAAFWFEKELALGPDPVEEIVSLAGHDVRVLRPRDSDALLSEEAFEQEEFLPYWADLWPSARMLAGRVAGRALRGARTLELGCGLGLPSIAAALAGGRVLATDWSADAVAAAAHNAVRNGVEIETAVVSWQQADAIVERAPWDLVLGADLLYERRNVGQLLALLPQLVDGRGEVWIADPGRRAAEAFVAGAERDWERSEQRDPAFPAVTLHRLRRRAV